MGMTQTLVVVILFVGAMACLPWLIKRLQQHHAATGMPAGAASRVLSAVAVGPQQRVVTVEVGPEGARTWLVLGVTAQNVSCLHVLAVPSAVGTPAALPAVVVPDASAFAREMAAAGARKEPHV